MKGETIRVSQESRKAFFLILEALEPFFEKRKIYHCKWKIKKSFLEDKNLKRREAGMIKQQGRDD